MWMTVVTMGYLLVLGVRDYKERKVPLWWLLAGAFLLVGMGLYRYMQGDMLLSEMILGMVPGVTVLLIARISEKAGYADGMVLIELGICLGYRHCLLLFCLSLFFLSLISVLLLLLKKVHKNTKMPYLTCLAVTFAILQIGG